MKKPLIVTLAIIGMTTVAPHAHAFDRDSWHESDKMLKELYVKMDDVDDKYHHLGGNHRVRNQIAELHEGIRDLTAHVQYHAGDPDVVHKRAAVLTDLMRQVEDEYAAHIRHEREARW